MAQAMQVKLLRALQERKIRPVGSNQEISIDVRIISATNKDLVKSMQSGEFRSDLFYRLNVISVSVPSLKERRDDIMLLMQHFLRLYNEKMSKDIKGFSKDVIDMFSKYSWPGNVRELENFVERSVALEQEDYITQQSLPPELLYDIADRNPMESDISVLLNGGNFDFMESVAGIQKKIIVYALEANASNIKKTSEMLKLSYRQLRYLIEKYHLK